MQILLWLKFHSTILFTLRSFSDKCSGQWFFFRWDKCFTISGLYHFALIWFSSCLFRLRHSFRSYGCCCISCTIFFISFFSLGSVQSFSFCPLGCMVTVFDIWTNENHVVTCISWAFLARIIATREKRSNWTCCVAVCVFFAPSYYSLRIT